MWAFAYLLLIGLKPCVQQKIEQVLELAPTNLVLGLFVLLGLYMIVVPKQSREKLKDLLQGGEARLQSRLAITRLREGIERYSAESQAQSVCLSASIAAWTALMLLQSGSYEEATKTASSALQALERSIGVGGSPP
jgi:hypothetical protein